MTYLKNVGSRMIRTEVLVRLVVKVIERGCWVLVRI